MSTFGGLSAGWGELEFEAKAEEQSWDGQHQLHVEFDANIFGLTTGTRKKRVHAYRRHDGMWRISYRNKHAGGRGTSRSFSFLQDVKGHQFLLDLAGWGHTTVKLAEKKFVGNGVLITVNDSTSAALLKQLMTWSLR